MRVQFIGNAQLAKLQAMFRRSAPECHSAHSMLVQNDPVLDEVQLRLAERADIVIVQGCAGRNSASRIAALRQTCDAEIVVLPSILVDGVASLEQDSTGGLLFVWGSEALMAAADGRDRETLMRDFLNGQIDMMQRERLQDSLQSLRMVEQKQCDVHISESIVDLLQERPTFFGVRAPSQILLYRLFERLCDYLGLDPDPTMQWDRTFHASLALPMGQRAFTPWDARALGLAFEADTHWHSQAMKLVNRVWRLMEECSQSAGPSPAVLRA